jgi:hypothetical protein
VPLLQGSAFLGGDDFLGAARERIFIFANGQSGASNPEAQGLSHLIADGRNAEDASLKNTELLKALRENDGDALNVLGDFPSLADPATRMRTALCGTRRSGSGRRRQSTRD